MTTTVTDASDLLAIIPSLIGKYPTAGESVVVFINSEGNVALCSRQDNSSIAATDPDMFASYLALAVHSAQAKQYVFITYTDNANDQTLYEHAFALQPYAEMLDVLTVGNDGYTNMRDNEVFDLPPANLLGEEPLLDRSHLFSLFDGKRYRNSRSVMTQTLSLLKDATPDLLDRFVLMAQADKLKDGELVSLGASLLNVRVRDTILCDAASMGTGDCLFLYERMASVCALMPANYKAPAAAVAAIAAYLAGDGMRANVAIEVADAFDPDYGLSRLISSFMARAMTPTQLREVLTSFSRDELLAS